MTSKLQASLVMEEEEELIPRTIPACAGEVILYIISKLSVYFRSDIKNDKDLLDIIVKVSKTLVGATTVKVYMVEDGNLRDLNEAVGKDVVIDSKTFLGFAAMSKTIQIVNQAQASGLLRSFKSHLYPFSDSDQMLPSELSNICAVPILNDNKELFSIIFLYNKADLKKKPTNFTLNDVYLTQAACKLLQEIYSLKKSLQDAQDKQAKSLSVYKEAIFLHNSSSVLLRREKCFKCFKKSTKTHVSSNALELLSIAMDASGIILHIKQGKLITPVLTYGITTKLPVFTQTSDHTANKVKDIWSIADLSAEPLWNSKILEFRSLLSCPIFNEKQICMGVIEFLRTETPFNESDRNLAQEILKTLGKISYNNYLNMMKFEHHRGFERKSSFISKNFEVSRNRFIDFQLLIDRIKASLKVVIPFETSSVNIINEETFEHWTMQGSTLTTSPIKKDTLIGHIYFTKQSHIISPSSSLDLTDLPAYKSNNKHLLLVPILNSFFDTSVISVITIVRTQTFTSLDIELIERLTETLSVIFENLFTVISCSQIERIFEAPLIPVEETPKFKYDSNSKSATSINYLFQIDSLSPEKIGKLSLLRKSLECAENPLMEFASSLKRWVPCKASAILVKNVTEDYFLMLPKETLINSGGLIQQCFLTNLTIYIKSKPDENPEFNHRIDSIGEDNVENILCVPVTGGNDEVVAVICLVNSPDGFNIEEIVLVQYFSLIIRELIYHQNHDNDLSQQILNESRKNNILIKWFKQVFVVENSLKYKHELSKDIFQRLSGDSNCESTISSALDIIKAITNSEESYCFYKTKDLIEKYFTDDKPHCTIQQTQEISEILMANHPKIFSKSNGKENTIIYPYFKGNSSLIIVSHNKKDETLSYYCSFSRADEAILEQFAKAILNCLDQKIRKNLNELKSTIRIYAGSMNTTSIINTIRSAAQQLLECDRATVFIRENDNFVVKAQGIEHEIPVGIKVPLGKGIVGFVGQTGQSECIEDVYKDPRFNSEIDSITGYRTKSMLCMPVFDINNHVIAALQMINKREGLFNKADEERLEVFTEMASSVLQNWMMMEKIIEERGIYLNILASIGNYVLVLNSEGKLHYSNKHFQKLFNIFEQSAKATHYSNWLRFNRQLVIDIASVYQNADKKISRASQRISTQPVPNMFKDIKFIETSNIFNYSISSLNDTSSSTGSGVIIILEDASALQELNVKFNEIQSQLIALTNPVKTETSLQRCINRLSLIALSLEPSSDLSMQLNDIITTLKQGNLNKTEVLIPIELKPLEIELKSRLSMYVEDSQPRPRESFRSSIITNRFNSELANADLDMQSINQWNLDAFEITDHLKYIRLMFLEFNLLSHFKIQAGTFHCFLLKVKEGYLPNPFHNFFHGFTVFHSSYMLLRIPKIQEIFNTQEILAILVSSLCHDLGHRGFTNAYEVNKVSDVAITYNDISVLENFHTAATFNILQQENSNIFSNIHRDVFRYVRKIIIECILSTDMMKHFPLIGAHSTRFSQVIENPIGTLEQDCVHLAAFIVHCCDIGHPTKGLTLFAKWSKLVCEEFANQYAEEIKNDLPLTDFMKGLNDPKSYYKNEVGFLTVIVKPLWECLSLWVRENIEEQLKNLNSNIEAYKAYY